MPTQQDIDNQQVLLQNHRQTLAHYLRQQATLGAAFIPPGIAAGIEECRTEILRVKQILRGWNINVEDLPDDNPDDRRKVLPAIETIPAYPHKQFLHSFREAVSFKRFDISRSVLHVVFGNIADSQGTTVILPVGQSFDLWQRGPRSVLASFERIIVNNKDFFSAIEEIWPKEQRIRHAGIGHTHYLKLPQNPQNLEGVMFTVTTRNLSDSPFHYGRYIDTPLDGIDHILDKVIECSIEENVQSITIPLLGAGYANIVRTVHNPRLDIIIRQAILGLTIYKLEKQLAQVDSKIHRGTVVIYSSRPNSQEENVFWNFLVKFIKLDEQGKLTQINSLIEATQKLDTE